MNCLLRQIASPTIFLNMIGYPARPKKVAETFLQSFRLQFVQINENFCNAHFNLFLASHMDVAISVLIDTIIGHALKRSTFGIAFVSHVPGLLWMHGV